MYAIQANNLTKRFGETTAVDELTLQIKPGELYGLLGPNGSGKTTTMKLLTGELKPTSGESSINDTPSTNQQAIKQQTGIVPEQETPPSFLTAREYLDFVANIREVNQETIEEWIDKLDLRAEQHTLTKDLSRGTRQKLMLAQAFIHEPPVAFIDEPLINLDPRAQKTIKDYLQAYTKKGNTILLSTHVLSIAQEICTRVAVLDKGKKIYEAHKKELQTKNLEETFLKLTT